MKIPPSGFKISRPTKHKRLGSFSSRQQNSNAISLEETMRSCRSSLQPCLVPSDTINTQSERDLETLISSASAHRDQITSSTKIINRYIRSGDLDSALGVFHGMTTKNTVSWNSILSGVSKKPGKLREAQEVFDKIPEPDACSYNIMLSCHVQNTDLEAARSFFDRMPLRDIASWNTMISGYAQKGKMEKARELFFAMPERNVVTWNAMISGYVECGELERASSFVRATPFKNVVAWTAMITGYMKFKKIELAEKMFQDMPVKNLVTWNAMISGYVENSLSEDALKLFKVMLKDGVRPNSSSLSSVLLGCSELSALQLGKQVHQLVCKSPLSMDTTALTSLISMYYKCGDLEDAWKLFLGTHKKDFVTWNAMISAYAQYGQGERALSLFEQMRSEGIEPDWITFIAVLLACSHAGFVEAGTKYFDSMARDYGVEPRPYHYTCMVDLLGRAGKVDEALKLVKGMPFTPHVSVFGTLLGACRIHKNLEVAEFAAKKLLELDPTSATGYVQLSNIYASRNQWEDVVRIRKCMKENKVVKMPGYSWIEVGSEVHEFRSSDRLHRELGAIHEKLRELEKKIKRAGYSPELEFALHDVGEEQKEELLLWHSEKLAVAFGCMRIPVGLPIRVFKNLRICGDCHKAIKYISEIERREIIVRDTTRFHRFKDGTCSCGDYW